MRNQTHGVCLKRETHPGGTGVKAMGRRILAVSFVLSSGNHSDQRAGILDPGLIAFDQSAKQSVEFRLACGRKCKPPGLGVEAGRCPSGCFDEGSDLIDGDPYAASGSFG